MGIGEKGCRKVFESTFGRPFPLSHPDWLLNPESGCPMELDGYNKKLGIAFEYQGKHHKKTYIRKRDLLKKNLCESRGIQLIAIEGATKGFNSEMLRDYIVNVLWKCKKRFIVKH